MSNTQLATLDRSNSFIQQLGGPEERAYMMEVMAATLNIPAEDAQRPDVVALMGKAIEKTVRYGWVAGTHMHVVSFYSKKDKKNTYTLIDGEKGWWDSAAQWRLKGIDWMMLREPMTADQLKAYVGGIGLTENPAANKFGMRSRVVLKSEIEMWKMIGTVEDGLAGVPWSEAAYTGFKRAGKGWFSDALPVGVTAKQVAQRRADKLAIMASSLALIPLDNRSESDRISGLTQQIHRLAEQQQRDSTLMLNTKKVFEDDSGMMWATRAAQPAPADAQDVTLEYDDFEAVEDGADGPTTEEKIETLGRHHFEEEWDGKRADLLSKASKGSAEYWSELSKAKQEKMLAWLVEIGS